MTMLSRRRCMLHEEKQWDYEWYPVNNSNQFVARFIDVQVGDRVIINYYALKNILGKTGYVYDGRNVGLDFLSGQYACEKPVRYDSDETLILNIAKTGKLAFSCFHVHTDKDGLITNLNDAFTGKYIKVRIER